MNNKFLGRDIFDEKTRTWSFSDGSGKIVDEARIDMYLACSSDNRIKLLDFFRIKEQYQLNEQNDQRK